MMTSRSTGVLSAVIAIALLTSSCGLAQRAFPSTLTDAQMLAVMNTVNRGAVEAASLAQTRSRDAQVQAFARTMAADHTAMLKAGHQLGPQTGIHPADAALRDWISTRHEEAMRELRNADGADFHRLYLDHQMEMLEQAISDAGKFIFGVENVRLKEHFLSAKPTLQRQFETARDLHRLPQIPAR